MEPNPDASDAIWLRMAVAEVAPDGRVLRLSDGAVRLLGPASAGLLGRVLAERITPLRPQAGAEDEVYGLTGAEHEPPWFRMTWLDGDGRRRAILSDASEVVRLRRECVSLTRLASAGRLISGIVHEINNPLSSIVGYSQLLLAQDLDREIESSVARIHREAQRTSRIVRNLLNFARRRKHVRANVQLGRALSEALELKGHDLRVHNISVHLDVPDGLPEIMGDHDQFVQVFVNLITNAEQAMYGEDRGGRLSITARPARAGIELRVGDTGPGIPADLRERVFEPFFTTKKEGEGTGLGLDLCRELLGRHDATIELVEGSEGGATFRIVFRPHEGADLAAPDRAAGRVTRVRGRRILVVEDDASFRSLITEAFRATGNAVHPFDRSEAALRFLERHVVDVILSDLRRPGLGGLEFLERVRALDPRLASRVLFLSGDTLDEATDLELKRAGNLLLAKPVDIADVHTAIARLLSRPVGRQRELFVYASGP